MKLMTIVMRLIFLSNDEVQKDNKYDETTIIIMMSLKK